jgi:DnaJ-class molecular chaperone
MGRIVAAAAGQASVLETLNAGSAKIIPEIKRAYIKLAARVHPRRGGNFSKERTERAF